MFNYLEVIFIQRNFKMNFFFLIFIILLMNFKPLKADNNYSRFSAGMGIYNFMKNGEAICRSGTCDNSSGDLNASSKIETFKSTSFGYNIEYFTEKNIFKYIKPFFGFLGTSQNAYYGYFGLSGDLFFGDCKCLVITPSLATGWYIDGDEIKLGNHVQFRSGGDIMYRFRNNVRVGLGAFHISNAGLGDSNPGSEQLIFKYQIPFN